MNKLLIILLLTSCSNLPNREAKDTERAKTVDSLADDSKLMISHIQEQREQEHIKSDSLKDILKLTHWTEYEMQLAREELYMLRDSLDMKRPTLLKDTIIYNTTRKDSTIIDTFFRSITIVDTTRIRMNWKDCAECKGWRKRK